jgi:hypothetical protein
MWQVYTRPTGASDFFFQNLSTQIQGDQKGVFVPNFSPLGDTQSIDRIFKL